MQDPYSVLEVPRNCTDDDINASFKVKSKLYHPDRPGGDAVKFGQCSNAKNLLLDRQKRRMYDMGGWDAVKQYEQMQQMQSARQMKCESVTLKLKVTLEQLYRRDTVHIKEQIPGGSGEFVLDLKLDPGMVGHGICVENRGITREDCVTGDVIIQVELDPRCPFKIQGLHLIREYKMHLADLMGFELEIDHPEGPVCFKSRYENPDRNGHMVTRFPKMGLTGGDDKGDMIIVIIPDISGLSKLPKKIIKELQDTLIEYRTHITSNTKATDITDKAVNVQNNGNMQRGLFRGMPGMMMGSVNGIPIPMMDGAGAGAGAPGECQMQ